MVHARRIKRTIRIEERNTPPSSVFDVTVAYASDALPEWFAGLQSIVEDETFTSMTLKLGEKVEYLISIVQDVSDEEEVPDLVVEQMRTVEDPRYSAREDEEEDEV